MRALILFPENFPNKGRFIHWDGAWNRVGYADVPQHLGQQPIRFSEDATPLECFLGGYLREMPA